MLCESIEGRFVVSVMHADVAMAPRRSAPRGMLAARRTERRDRLIASALALALLAGWVLNFVSVKELSVDLGGFIAYALARQA
jgi:hypothetical protein